MNEAFFNNERGTTLVQNEHFDEVLDVSQDSIDEISSDEGDRSPDKQIQMNMLESSTVTSADSQMEHLQGENSPSIQIDPSPKRSASQGENVSNTFYDERFEVNDDCSSIETNELLVSSSEKQKDNTGSEIFQNHSPPRQISALTPAELLTEKRNPVQSLDYCKTEEESHPKNEKEPKKLHDNHKKNDPTDLSPELVELFQCIDEYKPSRVKIEPKLKCFIPPYIPAIGEVDPFLKVPRPDNVQDGLGITVIDEPAAQQSDAAVLELQLRTQMKKKIRGRAAACQVRSIENASKNKHEIDKWIQSVEELRVSKPLRAEVKYKDPSVMPNVGQLMNPFPEELQSEFSAMFDDFNHRKSRNSLLLDPQIDLSLEEYAKFICTLLDVPIIDGDLIQSLHCLFNLCFEYQKDLHGDAISIL